MLCKTDEEIKEEVKTFDKDSDNQYKISVRLASAGVRVKCPPSLTIQTSFLSIWKAMSLIHSLYCH